MRADLYFIAEPNPWHFSCRLLEKAYLQQHHIYVHTDTEGDAENLNKMLWTFRQQSFIPHALLGQFDQPPPPIEIGFGPFGDPPAQHNDILLNLTENLPPCADEFQRVIEIIANQPHHLSRAEKHWQYYQEAEFITHRYHITGK